MPSQPLLELRDLQVAFAHRGGQLTALDGVSFTLAAGEILGVVGESGAGKSLAGAAVIGLLPATASIVGGQVRFEGRRIDDLPAEALRRLRGRHIAAIFQDPLTALDPLMSVGAQLVETLRAHLPLGAAAARARAIALLRETGIAAAEARIDDYPHQFSGGMRQRVVIALALAAEPRLLVADEPTTALDVSIQAQVMELLRRLCAERGMGVLFISHDIGVVAGLCDRVAVMYAGRLVEIGPVDAVLAAPAHPYTAGLLGAVPTLDDRRDRLVQIEGAMPRPGALPSGCAFHPRCPQALPRCASERPVLRPAGPQQAACWLVPEPAPPTEAAP